MSVIWVLSISKYSRPMNKYISICVNEPTNISSTQMNGHTKYYLPRAIPTRSADFLFNPITGGIRDYPIPGGGGHFCTPYQKLTNNDQKAIKFGKNV